MERLSNHNQNIDINKVKKEWSVPSFEVITKNVVTGFTGHPGNEAISGSAYYPAGTS
jgi:hypothetical protein